MAKRETLGTTLDQSYVQRVTRGARAFGRLLLGGGADWFGPQEPLPPQAPAEVAGRQFDYPVGYNLWQQPKIYEGVDFASLRALADNYDVLRLLIETRKDQMCGLPWAIKRRDPTAKGDDPRIAALESFFRRPDGINTWSRWLRLLLEDLLVIDAPTLYVSRTRGGKALAFQVMDGATIKPVIDDFGRRPAPPAPAYQQVLKGLPAVDYTADDLLYLPRNQRPHRVYGYSPVEQMQMTVNIALRRQIYQLQYYTEGNIPEALIGVPDAWNPDQIKQFQSYWDMLHEGDGAARRHAKFVPGGVAKTFIPIKEPELKGVFDEWLARVACYCFSVSPQPFVSQMNRATAETAADTAKAEGTQPTKLWVKEMVDDILAREFAAPDLEFSWTEETALDPAVQATTINTYVRAGVMTINEGRAQLGLDPINEGDTPLIYTAAGAVTLESVLEPPAPVPPQSPPPGEGGKPPQPGATPDASQERRGADAVDDPAPMGAEKLAKAAPDDDPLDDPSAFDHAHASAESQRMDEDAEEMAAILLRWLRNQYRILVKPLADKLGEIIAEAPAGVTDLTVAEDMAAQAVDEAWAGEVAPTLPDLVAEIAAPLVEAASAGVAAAPATLPVPLAAASQGGAADAVSATLQVDFSRADARAVAWAKDRAAEMVGLRREGEMLTANPDASKAITDTTRQALRKAVAQAIETGQHPKDFAKQLQRDFAFSPSRARTIARTEIINASNAGLYEGLRAAGVTQVKWLVANSERDCPVCKANAEAGPVQIGHPFPSGHLHPTAHPNCRCSLAAVRPVAKPTLQGEPHAPVLRPQ